MSLQKPILIKLIDNLPITDFCSNSQELCFSYDWSIQFLKVGANGNPLITIEVSNDNINWDCYSVCSTDYELDADSIRFIDDIMTSKYIRICVESNGVTNGNISALMFLKTK